MAANPPLLTNVGISSVAARCACSPRLLRLSSPNLVPSHHLHRLQYERVQPLELSLSDQDGRVAKPRPGRTMKRSPSPSFSQRHKKRWKMPSMKTMLAWKILALLKLPQSTRSHQKKLVSLQLRRLKLMCLPILPLLLLHPRTEKLPSTTNQKLRSTLAIFSLTSRRTTSRQSSSVSALSKKLE